MKAKERATSADGCRHVSVRVWETVFIRCLIVNFVIFNTHNRIIWPFLSILSVLCSQFGQVKKKLKLCVISLSAVTLNTHKSRHICMYNTRCSAQFFPFPIPLPFPSLFNPSPIPTQVSSLESSTLLAVRVLLARVFWGGSLDCQTSHSSAKPVSSSLPTVTTPCIPTSYLPPC
jgi:hypothetical protein